MTLGGFTHSEIHGSQDMCSLPWLIAAYHVLHRLLVPRHPPFALTIFFSMVWTYFLHFDNYLSNAIRCDLLEENRIFVCHTMQLSRYARANPRDRILRTFVQQRHQRERRELLVKKVSVISSKEGISLERRWSSRTFRYGYLVTTSPPLPTTPSASPS